MAEKRYRRLTFAHARSGFSVASSGQVSLWLGEDHLLAVETSFYTETYKRFYFRDIQAITLRLTKRRLIWNWVLGVPTALCVAGWTYDLLFGSLEIGGIIVGVVITSLCAISLLINHLLGPTCRCHLRTAVQTEELPPLCRLPRARQVIGEIRPLIAAAQGQLSPDEIPARMQHLSGAPGMVAESGTQTAAEPEIRQNSES